MDMLLSMIPRRSKDLWFRGLFEITSRNGTNTYSLETFEAILSRTTFSFDRNKLSEEQRAVRIFILYYIPSGHFSWI